MAHGDTEKTKIAENGEYNLSCDRYREAIDYSNAKWPIKKVSDISERVTKGTTPTTLGFDYQESGINFIKIEAITDSGDFILNKFAHIDDKCHEAMKRSHLKTNDVLFSIAGALGGPDSNSGAAIGDNSAPVIKTPSFGLSEYGFPTPILTPTRTFVLPIFYHIYVK